MEQLYKEHNFYFWEKKIRNTEDILFGNMDKKPLTEESVIVYIGIMDKEKEILQCGWSGHEDIRSALGFLQYVFLPVSFFTWIDRDSDGFYIPLSPFDVLKAEVLRFTEESLLAETEKYAAEMEIAYDKLEDIWGYGDAEKDVKLKAFCSTFNKAWDQEPSRKLFVRVFGECEEIIDFVLENEEEFEEILEEEMETSIDQFKFMCQHAYEEPLINKNLIDLLNQKLPIWF